MSCCKCPCPDVDQLFYSYGYYSLRAQETNNHDYAPVVRSRQSIVIFAESSEIIQNMAYGSNLSSEVSFYWNPKLDFMRLANRETLVPVGSASYDKEKFAWFGTLKDVQGADYPIRFFAGSCPTAYAKTTLKIDTANFNPPEFWRDTVQAGSYTGFNVRSGSGYYSIHGYLTVGGVDYYVAGYLGTGSGGFYSGKIFLPPSYMNGSGFSELVQTGSTFSVLTPPISGFVGGVLTNTSDDHDKVKAGWSTDSSTVQPILSKLLPNGVIDTSMSGTGITASKAWTYHDPIGKILLPDNLPNIASKHPKYMVQVSGLSLNKIKQTVTRTYTSDILPLGYYYKHVNCISVVDRTAININLETSLSNFFGTGDAGIQYDQGFMANSFLIDTEGLWLLHLFVDSWLDVDLNNRQSFRTILRANLYVAAPQEKYEITNVPCAGASSTYYKKDVATYGISYVAFVDDNYEWLTDLLTGKSITLRYSNQSYTGNVIKSFPDGIPFSNHNQPFKAWGIWSYYEHPPHIPLRLAGLKNLVTSGSFIDPESYTCFKPPGHILQGTGVTGNNCSPVDLNAELVTPGTVTLTFGGWQ